MTDQQKVLERMVMERATKQKVNLSTAMQSLLADLRVVANKMCIPFDAATYGEKSGLTPK